MKTGRLLAGVALVDGFGNLLVAERARGGLANRWELVIGKVEPGELPARAALREGGEETGAQIALDRYLGQWPLGRPFDNNWPDASDEPALLMVWGARLVSGQPQPQAGVHTRNEFLSPERVFAELVRGRLWCPDQKPAIQAAAEWALTVKQMCARATVNDLVRSRSANSLNGMPAGQLLSPTSISYPALERRAAS